MELSHSVRFFELLDWQKKWTRFEKSGFRVAQGEINAVRFGVAQNRKRLFLVGINKRLHPKANFQFPTGSDDIRTVRQVISNMPDPVFRRSGLVGKDIEYHPNHWTSPPRSNKFEFQDFGVMVIRSNPCKVPTTETRRWTGRTSTDATLTGTTAGALLSPSESALAASGFFP